ncbi:MAG: formate dehydrogenase accessory sulfurtransferase FdhD [Opitutaceae bacterium]|jgi:FdhD protein|nr:formate dehydrogenase accessory sulfurtransferase FdhD [Opitutaceae bacterium]
MSLSTRRFPIDRHRADVTPAIAPAEDEVAVEEPLEIRIDGRGVAVTMRTPGQDRELAAGFLLTEGVVRAREDLLDVFACRDLPQGEEGNIVEAVLSREARARFDPARLTRHVFTASSCGLCGKATIAALAQDLAPLPATPPGRFARAALGEWPARLRDAQPGFAATGGLHAAALFSAEGELLDVREDVGRHNALDKLLGAAFWAGRTPATDHAVLVSGRLSFELVQKCWAAGVPLLAGIGAPSSLAIETARAAGITLVGFLRAERANVYTGAHALG